MTLSDLQQPLADSIELEALAKVAGITRVEARRFMAALADMPIRQAIRIAKTCQAEAQRARERAKRLRR